MTVDGCAVLLRRSAAVATNSGRERAQRSPEPSHQDRLRQQRRRDESSSSSSSNNNNNNNNNNNGGDEDDNDEHDHDHHHEGCSSFSDEDAVEIFQSVLDEVEAETGVPRGAQRAAAAGCHARREGQARPALPRRDTLTSAEVRRRYRTGKDDSETLRERRAIGRTLGW